MSTESTSTTLWTGLRSKALRATAVAGLMVVTTTLAVAVASPAQAACTEDIRNASVFSSYAEAHTEDCSYYSNSYAQHGSAQVWSGWYPNASFAFADSGFSFSYDAANFFS